MLKNTSIRTILTYGHIVFLLITILLITTIVCVRIKTTFKQYIMSDAFYLTKHLAKNSEPALQNGNAHLIEGYIKSLESLPYIKAAVVINTDGTDFYNHKSFNHKRISLLLHNIKNVKIVSRTNNTVEIAAPIIGTDTIPKNSFTITGIKKNILLGYSLLVINNGGINKTVNSLITSILIAVAITGVILYAAYYGFLSIFIASLSKLSSLIKMEGKKFQFNKSNIYGPKEITDITNAYNLLVDHVHETNQNLENKVQKRTQELEDSKNYAYKLNEQNRTLITGMNNLLEEERKYIAREIHDELNATLIAIKLQMDSFEWFAQEQDEIVRINNIRSHTEKLKDLLSDVYTKARNIVNRIRPEIIDTLGLEVALSELISSYQDKHKTLEINYDYQLTYGKLSDQQEIVIYRIIQESLNNIIKHAKATHATIQLLNDKNSIYLSVFDNGAGFDTSNTHVGIGLPSIRERIHSLHGTIEIISSQQGGTQINISFPYAVGHGE